MKKHLLNSPQHSEENDFSLLADQVLNGSLLEYRKERLRKEIDRTLKERNKDQFMKLTEELKKLG